MIAVIAGAALWPVAAPLLGTSAAIGSITAALGLIGGPGKEYISGVVGRWARRHPDPGHESSGALQADLESELLELLKADTAESAAVRADVSRLLRDVGAVDTALAAASADVKETLATGLAELRPHLRLSRIRRATAMDRYWPTETDDLTWATLEKTTLSHPSHPYGVQSVRYRRTDTGSDAVYNTRIASDYLNREFGAAPTAQRECDA
jgi:hypothetical protein